MVTRWLMMMIVVFMAGSLVSATEPPPTPSPDDVAFTPVVQNEEWTPIEQDFDGVTMVLVPVGCFIMGSDDARARDNEQPLHEQCFDTPFWIDKYEVTQAQYEAFGMELPLSDYGAIGDDFPVGLVTWFDARDFCDMRGGRLPSEREWEYAARGVSNWLYPWGNLFDGDKVAYEGNTRNSPVGSYPDGISWVGALDMSGNAQEWTNSLFREYPYDADDGREDDTDESLANFDDPLLERVWRGGSYHDLSANLRSSARGGQSPDWEDTQIGFRCARDYSPDLSS
ncbi:MAG: formylglycine-generating enzyme family protein [bacterium]|nr:formylglycine-generating enzyme family protein [bacterium]